MTKKSPRNAARQTKLTRLILLLCFAVMLCAALYIALTDEGAPAASQTAGSAAPPAEELSVMVIDVGQGDSILVAFGAEDTMLIDAGEDADAHAVKEELDERGISEIDVLIATHPHADHIGGMAEIIRSYDIGCVYMPDMQSGTKTYRNIMALIDERGIELIVACAGESFALGNADCTIVSPGSGDDKDANNESVMLLVDYMDTEFLFTGDAERWAEKRVLEAGYDIDADVLKLGHHGSRTSTSEAFFQAVSPDIAVISCGKDNDYGHPHPETMALLKKFGIEPLRTDLSGDVLFLSDGHTLRIVLGG